jgi:DNA-directed RNA polymerase subunit RPC12/RpoP
MNPLYIVEVPASKFYESDPMGEVECPKCHLSFTLDSEPKIIMASDLLVDRCPYCEIRILVNMTEGDPVYIEGFPEMDLIHARINELSGKKGSGK